jgi:O-antigen/teichoic acid export membrane protein
VRSPEGLSLRGRLGFLLKDSVLYGGAAAFSKAFAFITFPLLARHFTVSEYGLLDYFLVLSSLLGTFFIFGQDSAVARYFYEDKSQANRRQLITQSLIFQLGVLVVFIPVLWIGSGWFTFLSLDSSESIRLFKIVLLQSPFLLLINFSQNLLKWTFDRQRFLMLSLGFTVVQAISLVFALLIYNVGIEGVLIVSFVTSAVFGTIGLYFVRDWLDRPTNFKRLREMIPYAVPFGIISVTAAFSPTLERTLTDSLLGSEQLGMYAVATKMAMLIGLIVGAFQTAWGPFSLSLYKQSDASQTYNWVLKLYTMGSCIIALLITMLAKPIIILLATEKYSSAIIVVFPLVMGLTIQSISWIMEIGIGISKRSYLNLISYSLAILTTSISIWILAPMYGLFGVGLGVMFGQSAKAITASLLAQRAYELPWHYLPVIIITALTLVLGFLSVLIRIKYGDFMSSVALGFSVLIVGLVGWYMIFSREERMKVYASFWEH